jgi:hypothetical protein
MKKLALVAATCALGLWGCANTSASRTETAEAPMQDLTNEKTRAQHDRQDAPTVYDGEATGGAGNSVTTGTGETWAPESAPGDTAVRTPSDTSRRIEREQESLDESNKDSSEKLQSVPNQDAPYQNK